MTLSITQPLTQALYSGFKRKEYIALFRSRFEGQPENNFLYELPNERFVDILDRSARMDTQESIEKIITHIKGDGVTSDQAHKYFYLQYGLV